MTLVSSGIVVGSVGMVSVLELTMFQHRYGNPAEL